MWRLYLYKAMNFDHFACSYGRLQ